MLEPKQFYDVPGSYNQFDIFDLRVDRRRVKAITFKPDATVPMATDSPDRLPPVTGPAD